MADTAVAITSMLEQKHLMGYFFAETL